MRAQVFIQARIPDHGGILGGNHRHGLGAGALLRLGDQCGRCVATADRTAQLRHDDPANGRHRRCHRGRRHDPADPRRSNQETVPLFRLRALRHGRHQQVRFRIELGREAAEEIFGGVRPQQILRPEHVADQLIFAPVCRAFAILGEFHGCGRFVRRHLTVHQSGNPFSEPRVCCLHLSLTHFPTPKLQRSINDPREDFPRYSPFAAWMRAVRFFISAGYHRLPSAVPSKGRNFSAIASRARKIRERTVPIGHSIASAISS